jgi:hypothetical protein
MAREYNIAKASNVCRVCGKELTAGEEYVAALFDEGPTFRRDDFCRSCWEQAPDAAAFSTWQGRIPSREQPKKTFVDDEVLVDFFQRLADQAEGPKVNFRFVLALMLMRKKLLIYDASRPGDAGQEIWTMHLRGDAAPLQVVHPQLDEQQIAEVTAQLSSILESPS